MSFACENLPLPHLDARPFGARRLCALTDDALFDACGVRIAFTGRAGGVSSAPYDSLNLGAHVGDSLDDVMANRSLLAESLGAGDVPFLVPNQVHGSHVETVRSQASRDVVAAQQRMAQGADAVNVTCENVGALLCYADCTPVIVVSPSGSFSVVHAGWRGVVNGIAVKALRQLASEDAPQGADLRQFASRCNVYIGPHIHSECFEVGPEVVEQFENRFGASCIADARHVSMARALQVDLASAGILPQRICDAGICTVCDSSEYYSYRASGGTCGRHGAIAFRKG